MKTLRLLFLSIFLLALSNFPALAQQSPAMADGMRADGKIYVVVGIILIVLTGLIVYLFLIDRKISRLEQQVAEKDGKPAA